MEKKQSEISTRIYRTPDVSHSTVILVVPFHNEALNIPTFISSLRRNRDIDQLYLLGVDHNSTDNSVQVLHNATNDIGTVGIIKETSTVASAGIPRSKGISLGASFAENERRSGRKIIIGSIDIDTKVSPDFLSEAERFLGGKEDFLVFPTRNDQNILLQCTQSQDNEAQKESMRALIGIEWLKFQLRGFLLKSGAIETRGSGGYFFTLEGYNKAQGHHQVFSREGTMITGESNAIGIRARRNKASMEISNSVQTASPRRLLSSITKGLDEYSESKAGKSFIRTENTDQLPILSSDEWKKYFDKILYGALRTFVIKAIAYDVADDVKRFFPQTSSISHLIDTCVNLYRHTDFQFDERDAIGSAPYLEMFSKAVATLGNERFNEVLDMLTFSIPKTEQLQEWAQADSNLGVENFLRN